MNEQEVIGYSVYVGIDWADKKHDVCICPRDSDTREFDVIRHCAKAIDAWVKDLHQRYGGRIAIAVELSKGPIVSAFQKYDFIDLFPVNPSTLAKYREAFQPKETLVSSTRASRIGRGCVKTQRESRIRLCGSGTDARVFPN